MVSKALLHRPYPTFRCLNGLQWFWGSAQPGKTGSGFKFLRVRTSLFIILDKYLLNKWVNEWIIPPWGIHMGITSVYLVEPRNPRSTRRLSFHSFPVMRRVGKGPGGRCNEETWRAVGWGWLDKQEKTGPAQGPARQGAGASHREVGQVFNHLLGQRDLRFPYDFKLRAGLQSFSQDSCRAWLGTVQALSFQGQWCGACRLQTRVPKAYWKCFSGTWWVAGNSHVCSCW